MSLKIVGPRRKGKERVVHSLVCESCFDPGSRNSQISKEFRLPLVILYTANAVEDEAEVRRLASWHESQYRDGKRHKLVATRKRWADLVALLEDVGGVPFPEDPASGHPDYPNWVKSRAKLCPLT
jgi:hypothetical protein